MPACYHESNAAPITHSHIRFYAFDELFPDSNLAEAFDTNGDFRHALRVAAREDFFMPDDRLPACATAAIKDPRSTLMSSWRTPNEFPHLSAVFARYHITCRGSPSTLPGALFVSTLVALCGSSPHVFGSWMDILGVKGFAPGSTFTLRVHKLDGSKVDIPLAHTCNEEQIAWWKAGSALNYMKARLAA